MPSEKEASLEGPPIVRFYLYEMSRRGKSMEAESRFLVAKG